MAFDPNAQGKWEGRFQFNGARKKSLLCYYTEGNVEPASKKEAKEAYEKFCGAVRSGKAFVTRVDPNMTVAQYVQWYRESYWDLGNKDGRPRTGDGDVAVMNVIAGHFGTKPITVFEHGPTFTLFYRWLLTDPIKVKKTVGGELQWVSTGKRRKAKTVAEYTKRLRHMVKEAKRAGVILINPFADDDALMGPITVKSKGRKRGVTADEIARLYAACDKELVDDPSNYQRVRDARQLMKERLDVTCELGLRREEMQYLQLEDVDYDEWMLTIHQYKEIDGEETRTSKSEQRMVPVADVLRPLFKRKREAFGLKKKAFLFGMNGAYTESFDSAWEAIKLDAGLDDATLKKKRQMNLTWHDIRGEAGTRMRRRGADGETIAKILGNTKEVFHAHYEGETLDLMRKAVGGSK